MKKQSLKFMAMAILLSISAVFVQAGIGVNNSLKGAKFNVPFEFQIAGKVFPAGEYKFDEVKQRNGFTLLQIYGEKQGLIRDALPPVYRKDKSVSQIKLTFNRYGDQYFLREINSPQVRIPLKKSKQEKKASKLNEGTLGKVFVNALK